MAFYTQDKTKPILQSKCIFYLLLFSIFAFLCPLLLCVAGVDEASRCGWDATNDGGVEGQGCGVRRRRQKAEGLKTIDAALGFLF